MSLSAKKLNSTESVDRRTLRILSMLFEQVTQTDLITLLNNLAMRDERDRKFSQKYTAAFRSTFIEKEILVITSNYRGKGFEIASAEIREELTREARQEPWFDDVVSEIQSTFSRTTKSSFYLESQMSDARLLRDLRLSIYQNKRSEIEELIEVTSQNGLEEEAAEIIRDIFSKPFQADFLAEFDHLFQINAIVFCYRTSSRKFEPTEEYWDFSDKHGLDKAPIIKGSRAEELVLRGELAAAKKLIGNSQDLVHIFSLATIAFLNKDFDLAVELYEKATDVWRKLMGKRKGFSGNWQMFLYGLALFKLNETGFHQFVKEYTAFAEKNYSFCATSSALLAVSHYTRNKIQSAETSYRDLSSSELNEGLLRIVTASILTGIDETEFAGEFRKAVGDLGYKWLELEAANLMSVQEDGGEEAIKQAKRLASELGIEPVGNIIPKLEDWERALSSLIIVADNVSRTNRSGTNTKKTRLVWIVDFDRYEIQPLEQKLGKSKWTKGRKIALKRLFEGEYINATGQDTRAVRGALKKHNHYYRYGSYTYDFDFERALLALVGHPLVFSAKSPGVPIELVESEPALVITETGGMLELSFDIEFTEEGISVQKETEIRFRIVKVSAQHVEIANSITANRLQVPIEGREMLQKAIRPLSKQISIQSDLEEHFDELPFVEPETRIHALLLQRGEGFHLEFFVKPFGSVPPYFKPGKGGESVVAEIEGVKTRTKRDLKQERVTIDEVEKACPFLARFESANYEWQLNSVDECLTAMVEMEGPRIDNRLVIEWPKGQKLKLAGTITAENLSVSVRSSKEWFEVDATAAVNEGLVLSMRELRGLLSESTSDFVEVSDGQFVAITEGLRNHLQALDSILDEKNRLHTLRSGILEEISEDLEHFKADKKWRDHLARIADVRRYIPKLPGTFEAELRPYQLDGFRWLSRLAKWGVGACLADDMGLGKTLQALAILVERAELGPALVVAPVSVCRNWVKEARRFSPTLRFQIFGEGNRSDVVNKLGNYDVLVASYSLVQSEEALITKKRFATVVLDEAQAVKNKNTKRSRAVMKLQADFRMVTTGTPIENHLGELWNLFNFINPGLLGSHQVFNEKFAIPIERDNDANARKTLQRLVRPFILRRRKNEVLDDLPPKTEIVLSVEMSESEAAFYESIRRDAMETIENTDGRAGDKRFRILAELTRLRLACCHPSLVDANIGLESSKLKLFGETLEELLDNDHKALVFSQFVKHLGIVEKYLQKKGISYQYLDGSTPANKRQERIDDFQRGQGDVFLISLKAGGTGLNLTAADYVIHLDPWWNPAVEDQATDRVHRIGQKRPVTVYRLVTENSVEEKILKLHETKRDLADSLLAGADSSGKLSADELLALISEA